jgi:hypothetical protein
MKKEQNTVVTKKIPNVTSTKRIKQQDFQTTRTKVGPILNPCHGIKKSKAKT